ncbi:MAG: S1/P1 Nuclease [Caulobacteraceae bacterium]|nr:S1/P1 Nuclease [Caulobacteraceae bacterium]
MARATHDDFDFSALSLKDLVEARDLYHFHLISKANVVGTAVGLYLIRDEEDWPRARGEGASPPRKLSYPRTFGNSQVRDYSWPCILVLVREWIEAGDFGREGGPPPWCVVPKRLYLPDGRVVPVCTVLAPPVPQADVPDREPIAWPQATFGGGLPLHVDVQGEEHFATIGCLMSDGHTTYALTARHACGEQGTPVSARLRGGLAPIGVSSDKQITRRLFSDVYPALPLRQTWLGMDVGLVRLEDVGNWTPNIYGFPKIKPLFDLYEQNLSLRKLIDHPVIAMGAASGLLQGKIKAMFYRYRSVGGFDYVSDFLISPGDNQGGARPGDSGALWHLQMPTPDGGQDKRPLSERDLRPLAIEWGAQVFAESRERSTYSVATSLSNICKLLDVELVVEGNDGVSGTWGAVGHYSIGTLAIEQVKNATLKAFLKANADLLSLPLDRLTQEPKNKDLIASGMVALADVPDIVWKNFPSPHLNRKGADIGVPGGRDTQSAGTRSTGPEHANHHCDADRPFEGFDTLPEACSAKPDLLNAADWNRYFDSFPETVNVLHRGIVPFRVWQFFERLKDYAATDHGRFIAAAGTLAHYVGDASQPLHGSTLSDGIPDEEPDTPRASSRKDKQGNKLPAFRGEGVHSVYETQMINAAARKGLLFKEIAKNLGPDHDMPVVRDGREAALATLACMRDVAEILPPRDLIDVYEQSFAPDSPPHTQVLWSAFGKNTGQVMAIGVRTLAMIWDAAWTAGDGATNPGRIDPDVLRGHYEDVTFMRSVTIDEIEQEIARPS